jgi:tetratricopeptide (TPR) repeat protein
MPIDVESSRSQVFTASAVSPQAPTSLSGADDVARPGAWEGARVSELTSKRNAASQLDELVADGAREAEYQVQHAEQLAERFPASMMAHARLAQALMVSRDFERAMDAARRVLSLAVESVPNEYDEPAVLMAIAVFVSAGSPQEAEDLVSRLDRVFNESVTLRCAMASLAAESGDFELAFLRLQGIDDPQADLLRGYILLELGQFQQALHALRMARLVIEDSPALLGNMAFAFAGVGSIRKAVATARSAWFLRSKSADATVDYTQYLLAAGMYDEALRITRSLSSHSVLGIEDRIAITRAYAHRALGNTSKAIRELKATLASVSSAIDTVRRAEIAGTIAYLQRYSGGLTADDFRKALHSALSECGNRSIMLARMLADASESTDAYGFIAKLYEQLRQEHDESELAALRVSMYRLSGDFDAQQRAYEHWCRVEPLNPQPFYGLVFMLGSVIGNHEKAAKLGVRAVARFPSVSFLRNNVAYEMALSGNVAAGERLLAGVALDDPYATATRGLLAIMKNDERRGTDLYHQAVKYAYRDYSPEDAAEFERHLAVHLRLLHAERVIPGWVLDEFPFTGLPPAWRVAPLWLSLQARAERVGCQWPPGE